MRGRLTFAQRVNYLLGSIQWFGDPLMLCFTLLLLATAMATAFHHQLPIRSFAGAVLGLPLAFLVMGLLRAVWAMKVKTRCTWRDAIAGLQVWFALSWVVSLACIRGLLRFHTAFLRTPKEKDGEATWFQVLRSAQVEVLLAAAGLVGAIVMVTRAPSVATGALSFLLLFQASVYANAPWASASAEGIHLTPLRLAYRRSSQNTGARPSYGAQLLGVPAVAGLAALAVVLVISLVTPPPTAGPVIQITAPPQLQQAPAPRIPSPAPLSSPSATPSATPSPTATPSASPSASPSGSASPSTT